MYPLSNSVFYLLIVNEPDQTARIAPVLPTVQIAATTEGEGKLRASLAIRKGINRWKDRVDYILTPSFEAETKNGFSVVAAATSKLEERPKRSRPVRLGFTASFVWTETDRTAQVRSWAEVEDEKELDLAVAECVKLCNETVLTANEPFCKKHTTNPTAELENNQTAYAEKSKKHEENLRRRSAVLTDEEKAKLDKELEILVEEMKQLKSKIDSTPAARLKSPGAPISSEDLCPAQLYRFTEATGEHEFAGSKQDVRMLSIGFTVGEQTYEYFEQKSANLLSYQKLGVPLATIGISGGILAPNREKASGRPRHPRISFLLEGYLNYARRAEGSEVPIRWCLDKGQLADPDEIDPVSMMPLQFPSQSCKSGTLGGPKARNAVAGGLLFGFVAPRNALLKFSVGPGFGYESAGAIRRFHISFQAPVTLNFLSPIVKPDAKYQGVIRLIPTLQLYPQFDKASGRFDFSQIGAVALLNLQVQMQRSIFAEAMDWF